MERKTYLSIVIAATLTLAGCASKTQPQYYQDDVDRISDEPSMIVKPFRYTGRTWFDTDKATLRPQGKAELDGLAKQLMAAKDKGLITAKNKVVIMGHTDSRASHRYNQKLSERRAASVAKYLSEKGIPATSMLAVGKGETRPVASNRTRAGMQKNRRVEVHIQGPAINVVYH